MGKLIFNKKLVTKDHFRGLSNNPNDIWEALISDGYIDCRGVIQAKFDGDPDHFALTRIFNSTEKLKIFDALQQVRKKVIVEIDVDDKLYKLLHHVSSLSPDNSNIMIDIYYDAARMLHHKKEKTKKPSLKRKEISTILNLIDFHYKHKKEFDLRMIGNRPLSCFFDSEVDESTALQYYDKELQKKSIKDKYGRQVLFEESGIHFFYKDEKGKHVIDPINYEKLRGKRLPWIANTIEKTDELYEIPSNIPQRPTQFFYGASYKFTFTNDFRTIEEKTEYFVVFVSLKDGKLYFDSAYPVTYDEYLKRLSQCILYNK